MTINKINKNTSFIMTWLLASMVIQYVGAASGAASSSNSPIDIESIEIYVRSEHDSTRTPKLAGLTPSRRELGLHAGTYCRVLNPKQIEDIMSAYGVAQALLLDQAYHPLERQIGAEATSLIDDIKLRINRLATTYLTNQNGFLSIERNNTCLLIDFDNGNPEPVNILWSVDGNKRKLRFNSTQYYGMRYRCIELTGSSENPIYFKSNPINMPLETGSSTEIYVADLPIGYISQPCPELSIEFLSEDDLPAYIQGNRCEEARQLFNRPSRPGYSLVDWLRHLWRS